MIKIKGKCTNAIIYNDNCEQSAIAQTNALCDLSVYDGCKIRIMPDVHMGKFCPIGTTIELKDKVIPYTVGIDIGCGITCKKFKCKNIELEKLDKIIRTTIPSGMDINNTVKDSKVMSVIENIISDLKCINNINIDKAMKSIGTLGGGNHFIELSKDNEGYYYLYVHSGSRHLGVEVTEYYQKKAYESIKDKHPKVPFEFAWLEGELFDDYIHDMHIVTLYALTNRSIILSRIEKALKIKSIDAIIDCAHNYIGISDNKLILRKGAISTYDRKNNIIIPINMKDGAVLCKPKENADWNYSAPHGSGRCMPKKEVSQCNTVSSYKKEMKGIYCSVINSNTLEESPFAYRRIDDIINELEDCVEIEKVLKPIYNFKSDKREGK